MTMNKEIAILETSTIIQNIFNPQIANYIKDKNKQYSLRSTYFILYEFKRGFIGNLIKYYLLIKEFGLAEAKRLLTYPQRRRISNAVLFLESYIARNEKLLFSNNKDALHQTEAYITIFIDLFVDALSESSLLGYPVKNDVLNFDIKDSSKFKEFVELIDEKGHSINMYKFFKQKKNDFKKILDNPNGIKNQRFKELLKNMQMIITCIENGDTRLDHDSKFVLNDNKHTGDSIIAIDMHQNHTLFTLDGIFKDICSALNKKFVQLNQKAEEVSVST